MFRANLVKAQTSDPFYVSTRRSFLGGILEPPLTLPSLSAYSGCNGSWGISFSRRLSACFSSEKFFQSISLMRQLYLMSPSERYRGTYCLLINWRALFLRFDGCLVSDQSTLLFLHMLCNLPKFPQTIFELVLYRFPRLLPLDFRSSYTEIVEKPI